MTFKLNPELRATDYLLWNSTKLVRHDLCSCWLGLSSGQEYNIDIYKIISNTYFFKNYVLISFIVTLITFTLIIPPFHHWLPVEMPALLASSASC